MLQHINLLALKRTSGFTIACFALYLWKYNNPAKDILPIILFMISSIITRNFTDKNVLSLIIS